MTFRALVKTNSSFSQGHERLVRFLKDIGIECSKPISIIVIIICLIDLYEITISLQLNTYPICDIVLYGSKRYSASTHPNNCSFDSLE